MENDERERMQLAGRGAKVGPDDTSGEMDG
jgi:hypothetical protein